MNAAHAACPALLRTALLGLYGALAAAPVGAGEAPPDPPASSVTAPDAPINPRYLLLDARGRMVSNEDFPGRFQLITFGYTSCPDVCPTTLSTMTQALHALGPLASRLQLVFISVDPERDTPAVLARYTAYFDPGILGLTGSPELVRASADHFKVRFRKYREPGANPQTYAVDHTSGMYLLGPDGEFIRKFADSLPVARLSEELKALLHEDSSRPREEPAR